MLFVSLKIQRKKYKKSYFEPWQSVPSSILSAVVKSHEHIMSFCIQIYVVLFFVCFLKQKLPAAFLHLECNCEKMCL